MPAHYPTFDSSTLTAGQRRKKKGLPPLKEYLDALNGGASS
jgi:hypothetical protein